MIRLDAFATFEGRPGDLCLDFVALPARGAAALVSARQGERRDSLLVLSATGEAPSWQTIDDALLPGAERQPVAYGGTVLCGMGHGFALLSKTGVTRWARLDAAPERFQRQDPFPKNEHGCAVGQHKGGVSDDPDRALVLFHRHQIVDSVTRYAFLRLDGESGQARWEGLDLQGEPPTLHLEDFPIPEVWRTSSYFHEIQPHLHHGAWRGGRLRLFVIGGLASFVKWGMDYAIGATVEAGRAHHFWTCSEGTWGTFSSSGSYLICRPLRKNGPSKGAPGLLDLETNELHAMKLPRGCAGFQPIDHRDGTFWLEGQRGQSRVFVACASV